MVYTKEDLETDIEWFEGLGVDKIEAKEYIVYLLKSKKGFRG